ncbi:electron transfer flavoprotein subunit beta/FixA family protein [bacterium]|nr:electron transfer flavoprotein subunit beta/FixA family protein [bacterium]
MRIFVCVKEVPDTTDVKIDPKTGTLIREGVPAILNPFDMSALEEALQIKDEKPDTKVFVISMAPPHAEKNLRQTIAMGADEVYLITDRAFAGSDTLATSYTLATAIKHLGGADLIFTGKQAIDGDTAQTGPGIAEWLGIPQVTFVKRIKELRDDSIIVERSTEVGYEIVEVKLPAVLTIIKGDKDPRLPSLRGMLKAKKATIKKLSAKDLPVDENLIGLDGSPTKVDKIFTPEKRAAGEKFEGEPEELAKIIVEKLKEMNIL